MKSRVKPQDLMGQKKSLNFSSISLLLGFFINFLGHHDVVVCQDLTIDNRLFVIPNDCYTRVSIGSRLADSSVTWTSQANSVSDCEAACSANGTSCGAFSFGVGARGNSTCLLGRKVPRRQEDLQRDEDYDVYTKGRVSLIGCRTSKGALSSLTAPPGSSNQTGGTAGVMGSGAPALSINGRPFGNSSLFNVFGNSRARNQSNRNAQTSSRRPFGGSSTSLLEPPDDARTRVFDILQNKRGQHQYKDDSINTFAGFNQFRSSSRDDLEPYDYDADVKNVWMPQEKVEEAKEADELYGKRITPLKDFQNFGIGSTVLKKQLSSLDNDFTSGFGLYSNFGQKVHAKPSLELAHQDYNNLWWDSSFGGQQRPSQHLPVANVLEPSATDVLSGGKACFRRLFAGKRIIDAYVRRAMECDRLQDCHRMCEYERGFTCEGFNYRPQLGSKSLCELTSMPPNRVDSNRDFALDHRYDFYERDWTERKCSQGDSKPRRPPSTYPPSAPTNWWSSQPRPSWNPPNRHRGSYGPPSNRRDPPVPAAPHLGPAPPAVPPYGGSFDEDTRLTVDIPRPIDPHRRRPGSSFNSDDSWLRPGVSGDRPLPVRPLEDFYPHDHDHHHHHQRPPDRPGPQDNFYYHDRVPQHGFERPNYSPSRPGGFDGYSGNGYSYGHPSTNRWQPQGPSYASKYPQRKVGYEPSPEMNEVGAPYIPDHRKPLKPGSWDSYGHSYADGYHTHYIGGPKPQPPPPRDHHHEPLPHPPRPSSEHDHFYGHFYNYGGGYGYSDAPAVPPKVHPPGNQCSVRSAGGFRLARGIIRKGYLTANLEQCESLCESQKEFTCRTFAYRYNLAATSPADNCLLSDAVFENLVFYTDLEPNRDYDIYAMLGNPKWCEVQTRPMNPRRSRPPDECFWRVRSGFGMPPSVIKKPTCVEGMGECQVQCVASRDFTCRSFVFRYETYPVGGLPNCFLSDWPAMEIDPHDMQDMDGAELYERGSFGRGCEPHHPIPQPDRPGSSRPPSNHKPLRPDDASCYADYDRPCKLTPYAIILAARVESEADCRRKCSTMRHQDVPSCMSFNYKIYDDRRSDNCYLSDIPTRDLRPGLDYTHDEDYILYVWKELEPKCSFVDDRQPNFHPLPQSPGYGDSSGGGKPYARPDDPYYHEITVPDPNKPGSTAIGPAYTGEYSGIKGHYGHGFDERFFFPLIPDELSLNGRFTVNGYPCRRGTRCERNTVAGFWSCEPEGAEPDAWDYCCEPSHHCGFSQGYIYPWCYVGTSEDQWRPCSEKYFPYQSNPRPVSPPISRPSYPRAEDDVHYHSRHWPVAFLHGEGPPNGTDSVALANDITDRTSNESLSNNPPEVIKPDNASKNASNSNVNHAKRRGVSSSFKERRKIQMALVPLTTMSNRRNTTNEKSLGQRLNSRFKPTPAVNTSLDYSQRFSRDDSNGQYYITKKLNAKLPTQSNGERSKGTAVAKIERISRITDLNRNRTLSGHRFVTVASSKGPTTSRNIEIISPSVSFTVSNQTVNSNATGHWKKIATINRSDV